jgi:predicted permease
MNVTLPQSYNQNQPVYVQALQRIVALPGVKTAGFSSGLPLTGDKWNFTVKVEGHPEIGGAQGIAVPTRTVTSDYFDALGLKIVAGRNFRPSDLWPSFNHPIHRSFLVIINQAMAKQYFPDSSPIGKRFRHYPESTGDFSAEIIGVVSNARTDDLSHEPIPELYLNFWQLDAYTKSLVIRTISGAGPLAAEVQKELRAIDPSIVVENVRTLEEIRSDSIAGQIFAMRLLVGFSLIGSFLALIGLYGVVALSVNARGREIAIRAAIGVQPGQVIGLMVGEGLRIVALGLILGVVAAIGFARVLRTVLFGVGPYDPHTLLTMGFLFAVVAFLACYLPARRAAKVDPMAALRYE